MSRVEQPSGQVTLVFTDIEGSTRLLEELGTKDYRNALAEHRRIVREACARFHGYEVDYEGDAFFYAFSSASDAVSAVSETMAGLASGPISIRVGIHTGTPGLDPPKYVGMDVHTAARIMSAAHGGQVVCSAATAELVDVSLTDLGEHRLKDIEGPVSIYQLGDGAFPPLKTISNTNLPRPASSFVGRDQELRDLLARIEAGARLVTLTGPGGTGKTRLALEAATTLVPSYKAGVFWVGLASLRDPALVSETIAQVLGAKDSLASHIGEREMFLLLDNFEQVVDAAPELATLLSACPILTLLVTSRELLRVQGEVEYPVPPLAEPEAVSLFCERSQLAPSEEVAELCARLDDLPLAVELAAARAKALSPAQILERLAQRLDLLKGGRDADPRQQTLRATVEWSHDLLAPEEQQLFARLSVFAGGCTLGAAEQVADADLDTLQSLVEKSLLRFTPSDSDERYWMLETIREFAAERLEEAGRSEETRDRHARWYATELSRRELAVRDDDVNAVEFVRAELDNARVALSHALERRQGSNAALLVWGTFRTWLLAGRGIEGVRCAHACLDADLELTSLERVCLLLATSELLRFAGDIERPLRLKEELLAVAQPLAGEMLPGGRSVEAILVSTYSDLADLALVRGEANVAHAYCSQALDAARRGSDPRALARALGSAGPAALMAGQPNEAALLVAEGLELDTRAGRVVDAAESLTILALCELRLLNVPAAAVRLADAVQRLRAHPGRSLALPNLFIAGARLALELGRYRDAGVLAGLTVTLFEEFGLGFDPVTTPFLDEVQEKLAAVAEGDTPETQATEDEALELVSRLAHGAMSD